MKIIQHKGMSLVEVMLVTFILVIVVASGFLVFSTGQNTWFTADANIQLQENLRMTLDKVMMELRQSRVGQGQIFDGTGPGGSDVVRFAIPVVCQADLNMLDGNGDVQRWGGRLRWGCTDPAACMDPDNDCGTTDFAFIEYGINNASFLERRVLDAGLTQKREDVFAQNITDFQVVLNGSVITLTATAQVATAMNRVLTAQARADVYLRN